VTLTGWESIGTIRVPRPSVLSQHAITVSPVVTGCATTGLCFREALAVTCDSCHEFTVHCSKVRSMKVQHMLIHGLSVCHRNNSLPRQNNPS
jgi:hypothetical protein